MPEAFELLPMAKNEGSISVYTVHRKTHQVQIDGVPVLNCALRRVGSLLNKRQWLTTPEVLETASKTAEVRRTLKSSGREQAWWEIAHALEDLVGEQARLWESVERQEALMEEMVSNTKVIVDAMDLFSRGENFMRVQEMGKLEGL